MEKEKTQPVHQVTMPFNGALLRAAIWKHENGDKRPRFTVAFTRSHREKEDGKWASSGYFYRDDLLALPKLAIACHDWIVANSAKGETPNE